MSVGQGLRDWLIQRLSAIFLTFYTLFIVLFISQHPTLTFEEWQGLFCHPLMQISTLLALIFILLHSWIGLWTVLTDYIKPISVRYFLQGSLIALLGGYLIWGIMILWQ